MVLTSTNSPGSHSYKSSIDSATGNRTAARKPRVNWRAACWPNAMRRQRAANSLWWIYAASFSAPVAESTDMCEYLASQGYIVIASPSIDIRTESMTTDLDGLKARHGWLQLGWHGERDGGKRAAQYVTPARPIAPLLYVGHRPYTIEEMNQREIDPAFSLPTAGPSAT